MTKPQQPNAARGASPSTAGLGGSPVAPFLELARVLDEYDRITANMDQADYEADFVMRAADWRVLRAAFRVLTKQPNAMLTGARLRASGAAKVRQGE